MPKIYLFYLTSNDPDAGQSSAVTFRFGLSLPRWLNNNKPILLYSVIELSFNAGPTNNINLVPVQLCTV